MSIVGIEGIELQARAAFATAEQMHWRSHDPFDLLLSPICRPLQPLSPWLARVAVQVGRRSGKRLRSVLRVPVHEEPKAIADYLRAAARLSLAGRSWADPFVAPLTSRLLATASADTDGCAWGLGFPYASRFVNVAAGTPNIYVTLASADALLDAWDVSHHPPLLAVVEGACRFLVESLGLFEHRGKQWLRYWPESDARIVNVQASAASLLARSGQRLGDEKLSRLADQAAETTIGTQRTDGSWAYSEDGRAPFVDGFHTGFVLQGLSEYARCRPQTESAALGAVEAGLGYFKRRLIAPNGLPRGLAGRQVSLDPQNVAQCVQTLAICAADERELLAAADLWRKAAALGASPLAPRSGTVCLRWALGPGVLAAASLVTRIR